MWSLTHTTKPDDAKTLAVARASVDALFARRDLGFLRLPERQDLWTQSENRGRELRKHAQSMVRCQQRQH